MEACPFSPVRPSAEVEQTERPKSDLDDLHWRWRFRAEIYRILQKQGFSAPEVDQMEMWQIGVYLRSDLEPEMLVDPDVFEAEKHTLAERAANIRKAHGKEPQTVDAKDITAQVMAQMGINTE